MKPMNNLEKAILRGAKAAQDDFCTLTGGRYWLWYGPESFLAHTVAAKICDARFCAFPEISPKKIREEMDVKKLRGRPPKK